MQEIKLHKGGSIRYKQNYISEEDSINLFNYLKDNMPWEQSDVIVYNKTFKTPRYQCWMGNKYTNAKVYSTTKLDWDKQVLSLKEKLEKDLNFQFDYLLLNYYKNGQHYISYHADNEVVNNTDLIGSISLGQTRKFIVKEKYISNPPEKYSLTLNNGDLLVMDGYMQKNYKHTVPKTTKIIKERINLTFRKS